jgi:predicted RNase H-like HicB family nuclease
MELSLQIEFEVKTDGRWIAEIESLPGVLAYGATQEQARLNCEALARQVLREASFEN